MPTSPRNSSLFRLKPENAAARRGRPTSWARLLVGATVAVGAAFFTFGIRMRVLRRFGQTPTGLVEDALTVGAAQLVLKG